MTVEPHLIEQFLPENTERQIMVAHPEGANAFPAVRREVVALAKYGFVHGIANKHGYLRCVVLRVPMCAALKIVRRFRRPPVGHNLAITKPKQNSKHWKPRYDNAQNSRCSRVRLRYAFTQSARSEVIAACSEGSLSLPPETFLDKSNRLAKEFVNILAEREAQKARKAAGIVVR